MQNSNVCLAGRELQTVDLELTEEQKLLQKSVREFAESEVRPLAKELDETGHFPRALFKKAAGLGLTGVAGSETGRGAGFDHVAYTLLVAEILRWCASTGGSLSLQKSLFFGTRCPLWTGRKNEQFL